MCRAQSRSCSLGPRNPSRTAAMYARSRVSTSSALREGRQREESSRGPDGFNVSRETSDGADDHAPVGLLAQALGLGAFDRRHRVVHDLPLGWGHRP